MIADTIGAALAISGSIISLVGALLNNIFLDHKAAMRLWMVSNPILALWSIGAALYWWNGGLSAAAMFAMYAVFTVSNWYGLKMMNHTGRG